MNVSYWYWYVNLLRLSIAVCTKFIVIDHGEAIGVEILF
jgi:hypothetical protein